MNNNCTLNIKEILNLLPHRFPFLLIDKVISLKKKKYLKAIKNVSFNEPFFQGHFPSNPIFPGVLILEAIAQATGILVFKSKGKLKLGELYYFASINEAKFKKPVKPGDQIIIEVEFLKERKKITKFKGIAMVSNKIVCEAKMMCARRQGI